MTKRVPTLDFQPGLSKEFPPEKTLEIFRRTCRNHYFELEAARVFDTRVMKLPIYLSVGSEHVPAAIAVGAALGSGRRVLAVVGDASN